MNLLNYKKPAFWIIVVVVVTVCATVIVLSANPLKSFDLEKTEAEAMLFSTQKTDLLEIGETAFEHYYSSYMGVHIPKKYRITEFKLNKISLLAGDKNEFCVQITSDYSTTGLYFLSANGSFKPNGAGGDCEDDYKEFRIKSLGNHEYQIVSIGTGGGAQGLMSAD